MFVSYYAMISNLILTDDMFHWCSSYLFYILQNQKQNSVLNSKKLHLDTIAQHLWFLASISEFSLLQ